MIVRETCDGIYSTLGQEYLTTPKTEAEWERIAFRFEERWNFPDGIGAVDGKRILIQQPANSGSHFYDYKGHNSVVLLAVFGPDYECLWANVGANGRASDASVWKSCDIRLVLSSEANPLNLPSLKPLPGRWRKVSFVLTGDDAFSLTTFLIKPFPQTGLTNEQQIFNYRFSCMRRISENGFGILASRRWRLFHTPILLPPEMVKSLVLAALVLHNYLRARGLADEEDAEGNVIPAPWRSEENKPQWEDFVPSGSNNYSYEARKIRQEYLEYFNLEGAVPWQWRQCGIDRLNN